MKNESWLPARWTEGRPTEPLRGLMSQIDELFNDLSGGVQRLGALNGSLMLRIDVSETPAELTVKADLPGVGEKDIDVTVSGGQLTIKAVKKSEADEQTDVKGRIFHRVERSCGTYQRTMTLPFDPDPAKVAAKFKDGVLILTLPKPPEVQRQTKKIEIKN